jgi:circadian clock protein KaiB
LDGSKRIFSFIDPINFNAMADTPPYLLKLFVSTWSTSSHRAVRNLTALLEECFPAAYRLEIIDINQHPLLAIAANITAVPLLLKEAPEPCRRLVGDMSDRIKVLAGLKLVPV